jgi:hypothetical protein
MPFIAYPVQGSDEDGKKNGMTVYEAGPLGEKPPLNQTSKKIVFAKMDQFIEAEEGRKHIRKFGNRGQ